MPAGLSAAGAGTYLAAESASHLTDSAATVAAIRQTAGATLNQPFEVTVAGTPQRLIQREVDGGLRVIVPADLTWEGEDGLGAGLAAMLARLRAEGHPLPPIAPYVFLTGYFLTQTDTTLTRHLAGNHLGDGLFVLDPTFITLPRPLRRTLLTHEGRHEVTKEQGAAVEAAFAVQDAQGFVSLAGSIIRRRK